MPQATWHSLLLVFLSLMTATGFLPDASELPQHRLRAFQAPTPVPLDGDLAKWRSAETVSFKGRPLAGHPREATVYALWDSGNLYLAFDVHSSKLQANIREHDGDKLWEDDGVEVLIDALDQRTNEFSSDDFSYHINILNTVYDDRGTPSGQPDPSWNGNARHSVRILDDYHYPVQLAIPWNEIGVGPVKERTVLGIDFAVNGRDPDTGAYDYFDWCGLKVFHDPAGFGELCLAGPSGE